MRCLQRWILVLLLLTFMACSPRHGEAVGDGRQGLLPGYSVGNVQIDPVIYHWADPSTLLTSAEGAGPRTLDVSVSNGVEPEIALTGTYTPTNSEISAALGYDVTQIFQLTAETAVLVPIFAYARVDAYPSWQKATFAVLGPGPFHFGGGVVYKPIGVYFDTCGCIGPDPCGSGCISGFPYGGAAEADGGTAAKDEDAGAADAGADGG